MLWIFLAVCWACAWCFDHNQPNTAILIGCIFAVFYLINRWIDSRSTEDSDEDI